MAHPVRQCSVAEKAVRLSELFQVVMNILPVRLYRYHCIPHRGICKQRREVLLRRMLRSMVGVHPGVCILVCGVRSRHRGEEVRLRYGFVIPTGDPRVIAELAREVEEAGWDGAFYWDGICVGEMDTYDPWVVMAAMAMRTERVRIGAMLTPPARRRPWKLARETVTLDHGGFSKVGEPTDRKVRARLLDEGLEILTGLWSGEPFSYEGEHYRLEEMTFRPPPVQRPRIPIWVVGAWPSRKSMGRALRYDGVLVATVGGSAGSSR